MLRAMPNDEKTYANPSQFEPKRFMKDGNMVHQPRTEWQLPLALGGACGKISYRSKKYSPRY